MLKHARPRGRIGRIVGSVNPLIPKPGTAYQWLPMEDPAITDAQGQAAAHAAVAASTTCTSTSSRSGIRTTRRCCRSAIGAWRRPSKPPSATAATGAPPSRRPASTPTSTSSATASHDAVLPWDIIDGGMKASFFRSEFDKGLREEWTLPPKRAAGKPRSSFRSSIRYRSGITPYAAHRARLALVLRDRRRRIRSRTRSCAVASPSGRSSAKLRRSPLTEYWRAGNVTLRPLPVLRSQIRKANQLQPVERPVGEVQLRVGQLARRIALVVRHDLDRSSFPAPLRRHALARTRASRVPCVGREECARDDRGSDTG